ncbi:hypothetical protein IWQ55_006555, partial [Labrenzia sp. EL_208]|nr:hypothetical protein [Labrenzia sp. EL_132]MBG6233313.1 hypothetical protein [Labrenzia sp. EL_208]
CRQSHLSCIAPFNQNKGNRLNLKMCERIYSLSASLVGVTNVAFQKIVLTSGSNAFEFANLKTTPVPIPAGALLLVTAVGGLALVRRRKSA